MKFSMAQFWGMVTLTAFTFAGLRILFSLPDAIFALLILSVPIRAIVDDLVDHMGRASRKGRRLI